MITKYKMFTIICNIYLERKEGTYSHSEPTPTNAPSIQCPLLLVVDAPQLSSYLVSPW